MSTFTNVKKSDRNQLTSLNAGLKPAPVLDSVHPLNLNLLCIVYFQVHPKIVVLTLLVLGLGPVLQVHGGLAGDPLEVSQLSRTEACPSAGQCAPPEPKPTLYCLLPGSVWS